LTCSNSTTVGATQCCQPQATANGTTIVCVSGAGMLNVNFGMLFAALFLVLAALM
jgi:hypothetical protein